VLARLEDVDKQAVLGGQLIKRWGQVDDLVLLTGQTVTVDGGFVKRI
jgi:hypothetical protein